MGEPIYHCALASEWAAAKRAAKYTISSRGRTLEEERFVHASYADQVAGVLRRFYTDVPERLCLLTIDPDRLGSPVVAENLEGGDELFPHIYGPIAIEAVVEVTELVRDPHSGWRWPAPDPS